MWSLEIISSSADSCFQTVLEDVPLPTKVGREDDEVVEVDFTDTIIVCFYLTERD